MLSPTPQHFVCVFVGCGFLICFVCGFVRWQALLSAPHPPDPPHPPPLSCTQLPDIPGLNAPNRVIGPRFGLRKESCLECCPHSRGVLEPESEPSPLQLQAKTQGKSAKIRGGLRKKTRKMQKKNTKSRGHGRRGGEDSKQIRVG